MQSYREQLINFVNSLTLYDYVGFGVTFILFVLLVILALMLRARIKTSLLLMLTSFLFLFAGPVAVHAMVKATLFKHVTEVSEVKKLYYSDTLLVKGDLTYLGKHEANQCDIKVSVHKMGGNFIKQFVYNIKPVSKGMARVKQTIVQGDVVPFRVVIEPFMYEGDYNITLASGCY